MINKEEIRKKGYEFVDYCLEGKRILCDDVAIICFSAELLNSCNRTLLRNEGYNIEILKQSKIEIGDIYKNKDGDFVYIYKHHKMHVDYDDSFYGQVIGGITRYAYDGRGIGGIGRNLCLDKKYKITEVKDE